MTAVVPSLAALQSPPIGEHSVFDYGALRSTGDNLEILNNGHTVQLVLPATYQPNVTVVAKGE
jgi:hypothetical protein